MVQLANLCMLLVELLILTPALRARYLTLKLELPHGAAAGREASRLAGNIKDLLVYFLCLQCIVFVDYSLHALQRFLTVVLSTHPWATRVRADDTKLVPHAHPAPHAAHTPIGAEVQLLVNLFRVESELGEPNHKAGAK